MSANDRFEDPYLLTLAAAVFLTGPALGFVVLVFFAAGLAAGFVAAAFAAVLAVPRDAVFAAGLATGFLVDVVDFAAGLGEGFLFYEPD